LIDLACSAVQNVDFSINNFGQIPAVVCRSHDDIRPRAHFWQSYDSNLAAQNLKMLRRSNSVFVVDGDDDIAVEMTLMVCADWRDGRLPYQVDPMYANQRRQATSDRRRSVCQQTGRNTI